MSVPPISLMNSIWRLKPSSVCCSIPLTVKYVLCHGSDTRSPRSSSAAFSSPTSVGYLWPTLQPSYPASAISLTHCSKPISSPRVGRSSLVQQVGVMPR